MTIPFFVALLLLSYLTTLLQSGWISAVFPASLKPDLMLIFVIYVGTLPYLLPGAVLIVLSSLAYELFSGSPDGFFLLIYLILFFSSSSWPRLLSSASPFLSGSCSYSSDKLCNISCSLFSPSFLEHSPIYCFRRGPGFSPRLR